jgi:CRISPR-associated endonuclease/helicase Cas3
VVRRCLSATLPHKLREKLVNAFRDRLGVRSGELVERGYPLATIVGTGSVVEIPCTRREKLPRRVAVTRLVDAAAAVERIVMAAAAGAAVVWVRNTVDGAIDAAALLQARGIKPLLFHARFAMADRLRSRRTC